MDIKIKISAAVLASADFIFLAVLASIMNIKLISNEYNKHLPALDNITTDFIHELHHPVAITDSDGIMLWYNMAFEKVVGNDVITGKNIAEILNSGHVALNKAIDERGFAELTIGSGNYLMRSCVLPINVRNLNIFVFDDITDTKLAEHNAELKEPMVAYFVIDNLDELREHAQDKYRELSGKTSDLLQNWVVRQGGIIKEYQKDKYICLFENKNLLEAIKAKFDILDAVREIRIEDIDMPVTISAGVSSIKGTLAEKEAVARQALDIALQRGGDQIAVKSEASTEYYGGKTKTVQKKTKVRSRIITGELITLMKKSDVIFIMGHKYADSDSIGACAGISRLALSLGCKTRIVANIHDNNIRPAIDKLLGLDDYKGVFVSGDEAIDLITSNSMLIVADVNNPDYFESPEIFNNVKHAVIIDHHRKSGEYETPPDIAYMEPSASSASELVAEILEYALLPGQLLKEEAELLLAGIILDTKQFAQSVGVRTFSAALYLRSEGANMSNTLDMFKTTFDDFIRQARFESNAAVYRGGIVISVYDGDTSAQDKIAGAKAADRFLGLNGVMASFVVFKVNGDIHISARSNGKVNVQLILEALGGGGHYDVAGAQVKNSDLKSVLNALKKSIDANI